MGIVSSATFLPVHGTILLIAAWPKSGRQDLERADYKAIAKILARIRTQLGQGRNSWSPW